MPIVLIRTNLARTNIPKDFLLTTSKVLAEAIGKPLEKFLVNVTPEQMMMRGGDPSPVLFAHITSIGAVGPTLNEAYSAKLCDHFESELKIPANRCVIRFDDVEGHQIGFDRRLVV